MKNSSYVDGYKAADLDNTSARAGLIEAIAEARREAAAPHNDESTRAHWRKKAKRWQSNLAETRGRALNRLIGATA